MRAVFFLHENADAFDKIRINGSLRGVFRHRRMLCAVCSPEIYSSALGKEKRRQLHSLLLGDA